MRAVNGGAACRGGQRRQRELIKRSVGPVEQGAVAEMRGSGVRRPSLAPCEKGGWHAPAAARERRAWFECNRALCGVPAAGRARSVKVHACPQARQVIFPRG